MMNIVQAAAVGAMVAAAGYIVIRLIGGLIAVFFYDKRKPRGPGDIRP